MLDFLNEIPPQYAAIIAPTIALATRGFNDFKSENRTRKKIRKLTELHKEVSNLRIPAMLIEDLILIETKNLHRISELKRNRTLDVGTIAALIFIFVTTCIGAYLIGAGASRPDLHTFWSFTLWTFFTIWSAFGILLIIAGFSSGIYKSTEAPEGDSAELNQKPATKNG